jgi:DNA invertase Pin-like site-specific DNA recombinase
MNGITGPSGIGERHMDVVMVWKMDSISRSLKDFMELWELFKRCGVTFVSLSENFNTSSSMGEAMLQLVMVFAELERKQTAERTKVRMHDRAKRGKWNGGAIPYGYRTNARKQLIPDPKTGPEIQKIFVLYLKMQSTVRVAEEMHRLFPGRKTRRAGRWTLSPWTPSNVQVILRNPVYTGKTRYRKDRGTANEEVLLVDGEHQALVAPETWSQVQAILTQNSRTRHSKKSGPQHRLAVHCVARCRCGQRLRVESHWGGNKGNKTRYFYLACRHSKGNAAGEKCLVKPIQGKVFEAAVLDLIVETSEDRHRAEEAIQLHRKRTLKKIQSRKTRLKTLAAKWKKVRKGSPKSLPPLAAPPGDIQERKNALAREMEEVQNLKPSPIATKANIESLQRALDEIRREYKGRSPPEREELFKATFQEVTWHGDYLVVVFQGESSQAPRIPAGLRLESGPLGTPETCTQIDCTEPTYAVSAPPKTPPAGAACHASLFPRLVREGGRDGREDQRYCQRGPRGLGRSLAQAHSGPAGIGTHPEGVLLRPGPFYSSLPALEVPETPQD